MKKVQLIIIAIFGLVINGCGQKAVTIVHPTLPILKPVPMVTIKTDNVGHIINTKTTISYIISLKKRNLAYDNIITKYNDKYTKKDTKD